MKVPKFNAYADVFRRWDKLLGACGHNAALLPGVDDLKAELQELRTRLQELKEQQEHLTGHKQSMTQRVRQTRDAGEEAARKLIGFIKSRLGTREELLSQFGIPPNRPRKTPRVKPGETPAKPAAPADQVVANALAKAGIQAPAKANVQAPAEEAQPSPPTEEPPAEPSTPTTQEEEPK
jgi:hypothetical protein